MQNQLYGLSRAGFEVHEWYPQLYQTSDGTLSSKRQHLRLRPPAQRGSYILLGPWCFANAAVVLDAGGSASQAIFLDLPVPPLTPNDVSSPAAYASMNTGTYWFQRSSSSMSTGIVAADASGVFGVLRPANITTDGGFSTVNTAAGDRFSFNLAYPHRAF